MKNQSIQKLILVTGLSVFLTLFGLSLIKRPNENTPGIHKYQCYYYQGAHPIQIVAHDTYTREGRIHHILYVINPKRQEAEYSIDDQDLEIELTRVDCNEIPGFRYK